MEIKVIASGSDGNCTMVRDGKTTLLLDAGATFRRILEGSGFSLADASGCFVTHEHLDHAKAANPIASLGIDVYASLGTLDALKLSGRRFRPIKALDSVSVGTFRVMAFDVSHDATEPLGFLAESGATGEKLAYFSDTAYVKYTFPGLTHIVAECNHGEPEILQSVRDGTIDPFLAKRIIRTHMSVERLSAFLKANDLSRLKEIHLIHMSDNNSDAARFKDAIRRSAGAEVYVH